MILEPTVGLGMFKAGTVYTIKLQLNIFILIMMIGGILEEVLDVMVSGLRMNTTALYVEVYGLIIPITLIFRILAVTLEFWLILQPTLGFVIILVYMVIYMYQEWSVPRV